MNLITTTSLNGTTTTQFEVRDIAEREVIAGETMHVQCVGGRLDRIDLLDLDMPAAPEIEGSHIRFVYDAPGPARFMVHATDGQQAELRVLACEPECIATIERGRQPAYPKAVGASEPRLVLRSLARGTDFFDGRNETIASRDLSPWGAG